MTAGATRGRATRRERVLLGLAAVAVGFAAADNYVVVLALPDMMGATGLSAEELQRAAPIVSGFLLGYIVVLPVIGRVADLRGRVPVLVGCLVIFALGSLVTATAYDLGSVVAGRVVQGVGAGGLLPPTLALVADLYPPRRRGLPLGLVGAVQELGNVLGPVYGALVLAFASWRTIFWINLAAGLVLAAVLTRTEGETRRRRPDWLGLGLAASVVGCLVGVMAEPGWLATDVTWGRVLVPVTGGSRWLTPLAFAGLVSLGLLVVRCLVARSPVVDLADWGRTLAQVDLPSALLLSVALAGVILAFATADAEVQVVSPAGPWLLLLSAGAGALFWRRNGKVAHPLVLPGAVAGTPAWGALVVSFFIGAAVIAALVDIPLFARLTAYHDSQVLAAMVLVRFLVGLPVGAVCGGWLTRRLNAGVVTAAGMLVAASGFGWMARWPYEALDSPSANLPLVLAGLGIGLAMAPVSAALLSSAPAQAHGSASALLIVARTIGKLVGISVLTSAGLHRFYVARADVPSPEEVCGAGQSRCSELNRLLQDVALVQLHTVFAGAAVSCLVAGAVALLVFRHADTREVAMSAWGPSVG
jgi:MFS family permease